jgi:hypothetical protein
MSQSATAGLLVAAALAAGFGTCRFIGSSLFQRPAFVGSYHADKTTAPLFYKEQSPWNAISTAFFAVPLMP